MTVARRRGFESRADLGLRPPRSISRNIAPHLGGCAYHHGGNDVPTTTHETCRRVWRAWQDYHMDGHGWVDLAYTLGVCQHGYVLAGRGAGVRTAANGTNDGNYRYYAVVWIGGARQTPTVEALEAMTWATAELRRLGAGNSVVGHVDLKPTACPHPRILELAREHDRKAIAGPTPDVVRAVAVSAVRRPDLELAAALATAQGFAYVTARSDGRWTQTYPDGQTVTVDRVDYLVAVGWQADELVDTVGDGIAVNAPSSHATAVRIGQMAAQDGVPRRRPWAP